MQNAINPLDGRYEEKTSTLAPYFSESALMRYRVMMEVEFLGILSASGNTAFKLEARELEHLRTLYKNWDEASYLKIKEFEKTTNHDVKSVEYLIKEKMGEMGMGDRAEWVHFGLTSEDTNNVSYALILSDALSQVLIPEAEKIVFSLNDMAGKYANLPMLSRTHGQSASPTTFGKEMKVFVARLERQLNILKNIKIQAKLNGAVGNYNAFLVAYPKADWVKFTKDYIGNFKNLEANLITTQIEPHDSYVEVFDTVRRINTILIDLSQDFWRYISDGWLGQKPKDGEVGSSTMPHKVNPIDFENAEGNLGLANALFEFYARKLPVSRLQRDLSDSTVERTFGTAFGHTLLAYTSLQKGLGKVIVNELKIREALNMHPEVLTEAIQTILRRENFAGAYEALKELSRGQEMTMETISAFIEKLEVKESVKAELKALTPEGYIGLAELIAKS